MNRKRVIVIGIIVFVGVILVALSTYQIAMDRKKAVQTHEFSKEAQKGKIHVEENQKKSERNLKEISVEEEPSVSILFNTTEDMDIGEDLLGLLEAYMEGEGKIEYPASWEENVKIHPEEGINKVPGVFDDPVEYEAKKEAMLSSPEAFKKFKPYMLSPNVDMYPIILAEIIKKEYADDPEGMIKAARESFSEYYPKTRVESIDSIDSFTMDNLQPFEILIEEGDMPKLEEKVLSLSKGVTKYFKEQNPSYMTDEEGFIVRFLLEEYPELPNGRLVPEGKKYIVAQELSLADGNLHEVFYKKGFRTE